MEEWRPIRDYEGFYSVSNLGNIRRDAKGWGVCKIGKILKPQSDKYGYLTVGLHKNNNRKYKKIHILIAEEFIGDRLIGMQVNHKNGIKFDNSINNLEYVTSSQNAIHAYENGLSKRGQLRHNAKLTEESVVAIRREYARGGVTYKELGEMFGVKLVTIQSIVKRINWKHLKEESLCLMN